MQVSVNFSFFTQHTKNQEARKRDVRKDRVEKAKEDCFARAVVHPRSEIPSETLVSRKLCLPWAQGRGRGGSCRCGGRGWRSRGDRRKLWGNFTCVLAPNLPRWPLLLEVWARCSSPGHRLPDFPPCASGQAPGRLQSRKNSKEPCRVQVCAFRT